MPPHGHIHGGCHYDAFFLGSPRRAGNLRCRSCPRRGRLGLTWNGDAVGGCRGVGAEGEDVRVELTAGVPGANDAGQDAVGHATDDLGEGVGAEGGDDEEVGPAAQLDVQDCGAAGPGLAPLVRVAVDAVDARHCRYGGQGGLFGGLAGEEARRARGQQHPDGQAGVL